MAYATTDDLAAFWAGYDPVTMEGRATALLSAISACMDGDMSLSGVDPSGIDAEILKYVACHAVMRIMQPEQSGFGITQEQWSAQPYSGSTTYANPTGDYYLSATEKRLLGIDGSAMTATWVNQEPEGWS